MPSSAATDEFFTHDWHKWRIVNAAARDTVHTDAFAINWPPASPVRVLEHSATEISGGNLYAHSADAVAHEVIADGEGRDVYLFSTDSPLPSMTGKRR